MGLSPSKDMVVMRSRDWDGTGKVAIVTGPTGSGIGFCTSKWLAERGCHVILAGRSQERLQACAKKIRETATNADGTPCENVQLTEIELDLMSLASVEQFVQRYKALNLPGFNLLINNAGIMMNPTLGHTKDGFEQQLGTNHVAHHYLTSLLLDDLKAAAPSRVINVASLAHNFAPRWTRETMDLAFHPTAEQYGPITSYGYSKLANVLEAAEGNKRYSADGVTFYACHPGVVATDLGRQAWHTRFFYGAFAFAMKTAEAGAGTTIYCATSPEALADAGGYFADSARAAASKQAMRADLAQALWEKTEEEIAAWKAKSNAEDRADTRAAEAEGPKPEPAN